MKVYATGSFASLKFKEILTAMLPSRSVTFAAGSPVSKNAAEIFSEEKKRIDTADCVIAEVTRPSLDTGGHIVYALMKDKPVLALLYRDAENTISPMIAGNPSDHLYFEHYDDGNLKNIMMQFLSEVAVIKKRKGRLIVIDGGDGSGKTVQSEKLIGYLTEKNIPVKYMDFPRYYTSFHGRTVARFLSGEFGELDAISPYLASLAYALDRAGAKPEMDDFLASGGTIVSNRYATSSMAHQGARLPVAKRKPFIEWLDELEYKVHKIPREDVVVYLYVPWKIGWELTKGKGDRKYLAGREDIMEKDIKHRTDAEAMYLSLAKSRKNWITISCVDDRRLRSRDDIHEDVVRELKKRLLIP